MWKWGKMNSHVDLCMFKRFLLSIPCFSSEERWWYAVCLGLARLTNFSFKHWLDVRRMICFEGESIFVLSIRTKSFYFFGQNNVLRSHISTLKLIMYGKSIANPGKQEVPLRKPLLSTELCWITDAPKSGNTFLLSPVVFIQITKTASRMHVNM